MVFAYLPLEQEVGIEPTIVEYNTRPSNGRVYLFRHSCIWYQNLVSIQATVVYETSVDADPSGVLRPRFLPRERLLCFRHGGAMR